MTTYPLPTLAPTIDSSGISAPAYSDIYQSLIASFKLIYGSDIYVDPDSQDGQWIAILAKAIHQSNQAMVSVYQSFSPTYSQGAGLSSLVKINGLSRLISTHSTAVGNVIGVAGTVITSGVVKDDNGNLWDLPATVTIPGGGSISVTVTAQNPGLISAGTGTINQVYNPQLGWQSFSNTSPASPGQPVETDAELRQRQAVSTSLPALGILPAILSAVGNLPGIGRYKAYENDTGSTDANGIPAHSFSLVAEGGVSSDIGQAIYGRKPPGIQTYGTTSVTVTDPIGLTSTINYFILADKPVYAEVTIKALAGYVSTTGDALKAALVEYLNSLDIGEDVYIEQAKSVAGLMSTPLGKTFKITAFTQGFAPAPVGVVDLTIAFNEAASGSTANIGLTVT